MVSRSLTLSFPFDGLDFGVHPIEGGHFNFAQRGLYYFGLAQSPAPLDHSPLPQYNALLRIASIVRLMVSV